MGTRRSNADVPGNLWPVCALCANEKGDMDGYEYIELGRVWQVLLIAAEATGTFHLLPVGFEAGQAGSIDRAAF